MHKEDMSSPPVAVDSLMLSYTIDDAEEQRDVALADIPGSLVQADMISNVHVKLEGKILELFSKNDPKARMVKKLCM